MTSPRDQIVQSALTLMSRQGYRATSWRKLIEASGAPWGSAHHYFPGGKSQLGVEAVERAAQIFSRTLRRAFAPERSAAEAVIDLFDNAANGLEAAGFGVGCPVAAVAVEVTDDMRALGDACAGGFAAWSETIVDELVRRGVRPADAADLADHIVATFEGALLLSRTARTGAPLRKSGRRLAQAPELSARPAAPA
jgi:TetR/AcrR family transcriptional regulator, lmrAB and yxaGH operons repressor